ncbi:MAG: hypothetical protein PVH68_06735 [Armatimonadota bacterium]|jgi:hypothetical protein
MATGLWQMTAIAGTVVAAVGLPLYCALQRPCLAFFVGALLGSTPGAIAGATYLLGTLGWASGGGASFAFGGLIVGGSAGAIIGACIGVAVAACVVRPRSRRLGALVGACAGLAAARLAMLPAGEHYIRGMTALVTLCVLTAAVGALMGGQIGALLYRPTARAATAAGPAVSRSSRSPSGQR